MSLKIIDYKILVFLKKNPNCRKQDILNHFRYDKSAKYRFENLLKYELSENGCHIPDTSYIEQENDFQWVRGESVGQYYDAYHLTPFGEKVVEDYIADTNYEKFYTFKHSFLYPILSAVVTSAIISYLTTISLIKL